MVELTMPPTIGAAMRFMAWEPLPTLHITGSKPMIVVETVIILGRTRDTAPSMMAAVRSRILGRATRFLTSAHASSR